MEKLRSMFGLQQQNKLGENVQTTRTKEPKRSNESEDQSQPQKRRALDDQTNTRLVVGSQQQNGKSSTTTSKDFSQPQPLGVTTRQQAAKQQQQQESFVSLIPITSSTSNLSSSSQHQFQPSLITTISNSSIVNTTHHATIQPNTTSLACDEDMSAESLLNSHHTHSHFVGQHQTHSTNHNSNNSSAHNNNNNNNLITPQSSLRFQTGISLSRTISSPNTRMSDSPARTNDLMEIDESQQQVCSWIRKDSKIIVDIDAREENDPLLCTEYIAEIYEYLRKVEKEKTFGIAADFISRQQEIRGHMRSTLVDWMVEVAVTYCLHNETLYLAANYVDRYLSKGPMVPRSQFQLLGVAAMFVAAKFEEVHPPTLDEFEYIADHTYTKSEIFEMESSLLNVLQFSLTAPTTNCFLRRAIKAACYADDSQKLLCLSNYLCELALVDTNMTVKYPPSMVASVAVSLALHTLGHQPWHSTLEFHTVLCFSKPEMRACFMDLLTLYRAAATSKYKGVFEKYAQQNLREVSRMTPPTHVPNKICGHNM